MRASSFREARGDQLIQDLVTFVEQQSQAARSGERLVGSTECLESLIGKGKQPAGPADVRSIHDRVPPARGQMSVVAARRCGGAVALETPHLVSAVVQPGCRPPYNLLGSEPEPHQNSQVSRRGCR